MRIAVLGAGAWGTALAHHAAARHDVLLWGRDPAVAQAIQQRRENAKGLPGHVLAPGLAATASLDRALAHCGADGLLVLATSVAGLRPVLTQVRHLLDERSGAGAVPPVLWLCKGIERDTESLPHRVFRDAFGADAAGGVLSGPSFAQEVAQGLPVALTVASTAATVCERTVAGLHHGSARIYRSDDLVGVELAGALKNVMAIAAGISDGMHLGHNARAALVARGLAEIGRLGAALGARTETFMGLSGVGDLVLTCTGDLSRNRQVGLRLAAGESLDAIVAGLGHVAEGVACARAALRLAQAHAVEMPIVSAVCDVLDSRCSPREALAALVARQPRHETGTT